MSLWMQWSRRWINGLNREWSKKWTKSRWTTIIHRQACRWESKDLKRDSGSFEVEICSRGIIKIWQMLFKHFLTETASTHITFTLLSILIMKFNLTSEQFIRACLYFRILSNPNNGAMKAHPVDSEKQKRDCRSPTGNWNFRTWL